MVTTALDMQFGGPKINTNNCEGKVYLGNINYKRIQYFFSGNNDNIKSFKEHFD